MKPVDDMTGLRFGRWTVIAEVPERRRHRSRYGSEVLGLLGEVAA